MEPSKISFRTIYHLPYPAHVAYLRTKVLTLSKEDIPQYLKGKKPIIYEHSTKICSLTTEQHKLVMYVGKHRNKIPNWEISMKVKLSNELNKHKMRYNVKKKTIYVGGTPIEYKSIELIGLTKGTSPSKERFIRTQTNGHGVKYFFNYGSQEFDYYGTGLQEAQAAWKTILQVITKDTHFVIFTTNEVIKTKIKKIGNIVQIKPVEVDIARNDAQVYHRLD